LSFNGIHGVTSQKIEVFITTAVSISDLNKLFELAATSFSVVSAGVMLVDYALSSLRTY
jgi:hypothetical protein